MKKFLSLVLALIMTMSLVTISAGATEYKDLTDKDEIQYEEAVAVLNRIGVITGYDDGSFRPETELTRGAAAKIIVSLLIGPEAASNLPNTYAPYPDVPANHTFAGVISYCKTAGIISGYGDGTFKPANSLTGYAFAKMLLGAIGYDSKIQGYTDTGWTMNVARDGNVAGLFNRIEFDGAASVNREQACQLALNTLKATMVEYTGGLSITAGDAHVTANPTISYKTSNQAYAKNISNRKLNTTGNVDVNSHYTVEFGEEHFKDLRLNDEHGTSNVAENTTGNMARDDFGRPSNVWSFKKVTIGTFPIEPDFVYTTQVIHKDDEKVSAASKVRALELNGYKVNPIINNTTWTTSLFLNGDPNTNLTSVADIADYTDNGTKVEVYVDEDNADWINTVVVVKTQLMDIKTIKSNAISLKLNDDGSDASGVKADAKEASAKGVLYGFNQAPIDEDVNDVEINDACYDDLKDMKVGDTVAVIPVWVDNNSKYDVAKVYVPETVSGELTSVDTYGTVNKGLPNVLKATVGGTAYNVALWNKELYDIDGAKVRVTKKDVTLLLDEYGNAMLAKGVGSTSDYIVIGGYHSGLVDGKVVTFVDGWDIKGNELSLNIGNINYSTTGGKLVTPNGQEFPIGNLARYTNASDRYAEWKLDYKSVYPVASERNTAADGNDLPAKVADRYNLKASNGKVLLNSYLNADGSYNQDDVRKDDDHDIMVGGVNTSTYVNATQTKNVDVDDAGIKVIYVTKDTDSNEVDSIEIKSGMQAISSDEIMGINPVTGFNYGRAQACVNLKSGAVTGDSVVKAIVVKKESGSANLTDLVYISNYVGSINRAVGTDASSKPVYGYEVHFLGQDNWDDEVTIYTTTSLKIGDFAKARKDANVPSITGVTEDNYYRTTKYGDDGGVQIHKALSVLPTAGIQKIFGNNKTLLKLMNYNNDENDVLRGQLGANAPTDTNSPKLANIAGAFKSDDTLDLGGEAVNNIVSIRKAKIIDLTKNGIDSASDLKDLWDDINGNTAKNYHPLIKVSLVFNDKWDDDSFRTVYALVITSVDTGTNGRGVYIPNSDTDPVTYATPKWTGNAVKDTDYKVTGSDDKYTVTPLNNKTLDIPAGTGYTAKENADGSWTVTITDSKNKTVNVPVNDASVVVEKALNVVLHADDIAAGISIKGVHTLTSADVTNNTYGTGKTVGDIAVILDLPAGVTMKNGGTATISAVNGNGFTVTSGASDTLAAADKCVVFDTSAVGSLDKSLTYTMTSILGAVGKVVKVVDETGKGLTFTTGTETLATTGAGAALNVTVTSGAPKYAKTASVVYTVTGLKSGTLAGTAGTGDDAGKQISAGLTVTATTGALAQLAISSDAVADTAAENVVITIKEIRVATITPTITGGTATFSPTDVTVGTKFGLPAITATLGTAVQEAKIKVSISNVTTDDSTNFPTTDRLIDLTSGASTQDGAAHYTPTGAGEVKVTVTPVVTKLKKAAATWSLSGTDATGVTVDALGDDIAVENGANKAAITLTLNKTGLAENAQISLKVVDGASTTVTDNVFTSAKAVASANKTTLTINAGELTNITGNPITVIVTIINP